MLFNSHAFIFFYLPLTLAGFFAFARIGQRPAAAFLAIASLFFYGWWNPNYLLLLCGSIVFNYLAGVQIARTLERGKASQAYRMLWFAVAADLALLAYYKYAVFFLKTFDAVAGVDIEIPEIILPLGISFFTFTQIAFLVDTYRGKVREYNFVHFVLFVSYFPHLIAGPVLHHKEMMPQFGQASTYRINSRDVAVGLTIFSIGLFKKVILADSVAVYVAPVFDAAAAGGALTTIEAWGGALAYTLQLYFDFSGYSDMAIGLSRLFGIRLPLNFDSPYKATNIIEFWRRWHMTLSRFLRDYLYFSLGGNRLGPIRRHLNLFATMLLGGLWHGAGWTFVVWGALHGFYLVVNHAWRTFFPEAGAGKQGLLKTFLYSGLTFFAVVVGWVVFRAADIHAAQNMLCAMFGGNGTILPSGLARAFDGVPKDWLASFGVSFGAMPLFHGASQVAWVGALLAIAWFAPNTQEFMRRYEPALDFDAANSGGSSYSRLQWRPNGVWMLVICLIAVYAMTEMTKVSEFLYFQF